MKPKAVRKRLAGQSGFRLPGTLLGLGVSLTCLALAFRGVNASAVVSTLTRTDLVLGGIAFFSAMLATAGSTMRWRELLSPYQPRPARLFQVFMISHLANTLLPWKLGTFLRAYLAADVEGIGLGFVMGTVVVERLLDALIVAVLFLLIIPTVALPQFLHNSGVGISLAIIPMFLLLLAMLHLRPSWLPRLRQRILGNSPTPRNWPARFLQQGLQSLDVLARLDQYLPILAWSLVIWSAGALANAFALRAMGISVSYLVPVVLLVTLQIGNKVPTVPANIGVFHYVTVLTLGLFGIDRTAALSYAFMLHAVVFLAPAVVGAACLWKWQRDFGGVYLARLAERVRRAEQEDQP